MPPHDKGRPLSDDLRATLEEFEQTIREADLVRGHVERQLNRKPFFPERRNPKRWEKAGEGED